MEREAHESAGGPWDHLRFGARAHSRRGQEDGGQSCPSASRCDSNATGSKPNGFRLPCREYILLVTFRAAERLKACLLALAVQKAASLTDLATSLLE